MRRALIFTSIFAVVLLGLVGLGDIAPSAAQDASPMEDGQGFVGSWRLTISGANHPPFLGLITFGADGTVVASPPPVVPPPGGSDAVLFTTAGHGAWDATSPETASFTFVILTADGQSKPFGTRTIRGSLTLGPDAQTSSGEATVTFVDAGGNTLATIPETIQAERIVAEAPRMPSMGTPSAATPDA